MMTIIYFLLAALALGILVFIHELGHFYIARRTGMTVETFSIGFGRPVLKWRWDDVNWQLGWLPFGGYVKIAGMEFGKKDKDTYLEPYEIPNGFFSRPPFQRILVAIAGPVSNFILAFLLFFILWSMGGREKSFSEFTQIIGWVDPKSELYAQGVRPGDLLKEYNGHPFTNSKDLLYAAMLADRKVELKGARVDYKTGEQAPFNHTVESYQSPQAVDGILTTGILTTGRYLIYNPLPNGTSNPLPEGSPMAGSGIEYGDRLVWADGEILFSMEQLSHLLNARKALLTVKRGNETFLTRQPRIAAGDLIVPFPMRNEIIDWQYEAGIKRRWQDLIVLPYILAADGTVESRMEFIDEETEKEVFPMHLYSTALEKPLQKGDKIIAIDGVAVNTSYQLLDLIQTHHAVLIVQKNVPVATHMSWKLEDQAFMQNLHPQIIEEIAATIGSDTPLKEKEGFALLRPVEPKSINQFNFAPADKERIENEYAAKRQEFAKIKNPETRARAFQILEKEQNKYLLGINLQDQTVDYNPSPFRMFSNVFVETWLTLKALVMGYLNPKWLSGPVGIVQVIHHGWKVGIGEALFWIGAISLNLGVLNLLPIPVLDGGYICLSLWEWITKRRMKAKTMERLIIPFVVLMIGLLIFLTFQDITRLF